MNGSSLEAACFDLYDYTEFFRAIRSVTETRRHRELKFSISEDVIELLIRPLYGRQDSLKAAVRELLKNALDACRMKKKEKEERGEKESGAEITVRLEKGGGRIGSWSSATMGSAWTQRTSDPIFSQWGRPTKGTGGWEPWGNTGSASCLFF